MKLKFRIFWLSLLVCLTVVLAGCGDPASKYVGKWLTFDGSVGLNGGDVYILNIERNGNSKNGYLLTKIHSDYAYHAIEGKYGNNYVWTESKTKPVTATFKDDKLYVDGEMNTQVYVFNEKDKTLMFTGPVKLVYKKYTDEDYKKFKPVMKASILKEQAYFISKGLIVTFTD